MNSNHVRGATLAIGAIALLSGLASAHVAPDSHGHMILREGPGDCEITVEVTHVEADEILLQFLRETDGDPLVLREVELTGGVEKAGWDGFHFPEQTFTFTEETRPDLVRFLVEEEYYEEGDHEGEDHEDDELHGAMRSVDVEGCDGAEGALACPGSLDARPLASGAIRLTWDPVAGADGYRVFRATDDDFVEVGETDDVEFVDEATPPGQTFRYFVEALDDDGGSSRDCEDGAVEATAIPFFPSALAGLAAVGAGLAALGWMRRK